MKEIDKVIENIENLYWVQNTQCVEVTGVHKSTFPPVIRKCRVGYDQIDAFMLNTKKYGERGAFDWYIDYEDFQSLPASCKEHIWVLCLLSYAYIEKGIINHPITLRTQEALIVWASTLITSDHPEFGIRTLQHAIALGSEEAKSRLEANGYDECYQEDIVPVDQKMELS